MEIKTGIDAEMAAPIKLSAGGIAEFERDLEAVLHDRPEILWLDCSRLEFVTSSHINVMWTTHLQCAKFGVAMRLRSPTPGLIRVLKVLDLYDLFECDDDETLITPSKQSAPIPADQLMQEYHDEFWAEQESSNEALIEFLEFLADLGLPQMIEFELRTLFYEVVTNIRTHSGISERDKIDFSAKAGEQRIFLEFTDSGMPFDLTNRSADFEPLTAGKNRQKRGIGISMVHKLADAISYRRTEDAHNVVVIEKRWE